MSNYSDFLKVPYAAIKKVYQLAHSDTINVNHDEIFRIVTELDLLLLIKLALKDAKVDELCKLPIFDDYWNEIWRLCGENTQEEALINKLPIHEYQGQATVNTFDFIKGIALFEQYRAIINSKINNAEMMALPYLTAAVNLDYFPAIAIENKRLIQLAKQNKDIVLGYQAIEIASRAAEKYWAAGYLLLGVSFIQLAEKKDTFFIMEGLKALLVAKKLEPYSQAMLNNAFQGQSLSIVTYGEIKDWDDVMSYFSKSQPLLKISEINQIYKGANDMFDIINNKWLTSQESLSYPSLSP